MVSSIIPKKIIDLVRNLKNVQITAGITVINSVIVQINAAYQISIIMSSATTQLPSWAMYETALFHNGEIVNRPNLGYHSSLLFSDFDGLRTHIEFVRYTLNG